MTTATELKEVRVLNSKLNTHYYLYLRDDRLAAFYDFVLSNRNTTLPPRTDEYFPAPVVTALNTIFAQIPSRFPIADILAWLRDEQKNHFGDYPNPTITTQEIEAALVKFGQQATMLRGDGSEII